MLSHWFRDRYGRKHPQRRNARLNLVTLEDRLAPAVAFALSGTNLLTFDTAAPTLTNTVAITGVNGSETLVGIDVRPQNGILYGLGVNATNDTATLYAISHRTGLAVAVGATGQVTFTTDGTIVVDLPDPATVGYGFDFNPAADRVRVVAGSLNFRVNPNDGSPIDGDNTGLTSGTITGTNPDGPINTGTSSVDATAYTNNQPTVVATPVTTQYTLDAASNMLFIQNPPNTGTQTLGQNVTLGGATLDFTAVNGFDIPSGVNTTANNVAVVAGSAFAVLNVGGTTGLYSIDLTNGVATFIGNVGNGTTAVQGFTVQNDLGGFPVLGLGGTAMVPQLVRFNTALPGTSASVNITGIASLDVLVGIDFRPATGQLYGLGVNEGANTATLYLIDPQSGAATVVGAAAGQIAYVQADGTTAVDLPDPATAGYGFDFNPVADRVRVTTSTGLNFRINQLNGLPVDGDGTGLTTGTVTGINTDGPISGLPGGSTGVSATAYTQNSSGNFTTQYTLDAASNSLFIQNPSNTGAQTNQLPVTLNGAPLDFTDINGFDILPGVFTTATGSPVTSGRALATLNVGGTSTLYFIDLVTGAATLVGPAPTALSGLTMADAPAGTINFASAAIGVTENASTVTVNLTRSGGSNGPATVTVNVTGGSAVAGTDFTGTPLMITFADGATTASGTITIVDDMMTDGNKTINLALANPTNASVLGATNTAVVTIVDNEGAPAIASGVAYALSNSSLIAFDTANPSAALAPLPITGVTTGDVLVGIDFRPQNGHLYALGINFGAATGTVYTVSLQTGLATVVGTFTVPAGTTLADPATTGYGFDFNPLVDRIRVIVGSDSFVVDPNNGAFVAANGDINGGTTTVDATAYTNNMPNAAATTQYSLDANTDTLYLQNPGTGALTTIGVVTLNGATLNFTAVNGFDIPPGINAAASIQPVAGSAFAVLTVGGVAQLYLIDLTSGAATLAGPVGTGTSPIQGFAFQGEPVAGGTPLIGLGGTAVAPTLVRFNSATPGTQVTVNITGLNANEVLVGIDFRPATGQLYGLGVNAGANTATLYRIDPQTGAAIAIGTPGSIAYVQADGTTPVDLPDPATAGYGFDFNPVADRVRVTISTGLNFRINQLTGQPVDGDGTGTSTGMVTGTNTDGPITGLPGGSTGVSATAYTNSGGTATTQYTLDAASNSLFIQNPSNTGAQINQLPVTLNGAPLDFTDINGFDIPIAIGTTATGSPVSSGRAFAVLTVGGVSRLFSINLVTGAATDLGAAPTTLTGLTAAQAPVGSVSFASATASVTEGGTATITLNRTGGTTGAITVTVNVTGGTATPGSDFNAVSFVVIIPDGATSATFSIPTIDDTLIESNETLILTIANVTAGAVIGTQQMTTLTITDNDGLPIGPVPQGPVGVGPSVTITNPNGTSVTVTPFPGYNGPVTTAQGDINGDGVRDTIVGAGINAHVKVIDGATGAEIRSFLAFPGFSAGVFVGSGDVNNDGFDDIIVGAFASGHVKVFSGRTGAELYSFFAYPGYLGSVTVAGGDIDGDGFDDIITGAITGHAKAFSGRTGQEIRSFFAYTGFIGQVFVGTGDVNGDGFDDIITGAGSPAPGGHVKVFDGPSNAEIRSFFAYDQSLTGGVRVASRLANADVFADIVTAPGPGGNANVRTFDALTGQVISDVIFSDPLNFGIFVG